jgi:ATP adenylyltransferase/5',5'''-P-1,P-4-tetraphosphate phosphorylase II
LIDDEVEIIDNHYSVILTTEWLLLIPRKTHEVSLQNGILNINTIGFLLTILIRNEKLLEEVKRVNILEDVFSNLL